VRLAFREALMAFRRAPLLSALGITTIAFSLFAFGLFGLVVLNIRDALQKVEERVEIRAFLADGTPIETISAMVGDVSAFPEVQRVEFITQEQALIKARRELAEFSDVVDASILPASIDIRLKQGFRDPVTVKAIATRMKAYPVVDDVRFGEEWVEKLHKVRTVATVSGLALGLTFAAVAVIIISATIRMAVLARSREIGVMRLVGATDGFVRRPFLIEGFVKGIIGGLGALALTWFASELISRYFVSTVFFERPVAVAGVLGGAMLGLLGSAVSVGRQLRRV
jgi:cell division transport system permease protein